MFIFVAYELVHSSERRVIAAFCMNVCYALGGSLASLVAYLLPHWNWQFWMFAALQILCLPLLW